MQILLLHLVKQPQPQLSGIEIAAKWQRASDLMSTVPQKHSRYQEAKIRTQLYKKYSEAAQKEADKSKS
ncbi:hypothetical protein ANSO36C_33450 [Nostoc cf. commune SO-36]|uniref:Uncharacterized protein n=1 Tax=Nostoc cf. commune SO-36 TaxID=449208 RepID=A0ABM7Z3G0_NOSCO|nr:hypothetical protein ANSO36C_33450 [Nostoc cf. commune SO-36]